jgi:hypothetical protein
VYLNFLIVCGYTTYPQISERQYWITPIYIAFTDKVERNFHFPASGENCYIVGELILLFYGAILDWYQKSLVVLSSESRSSSRGPGSDSYVQLYQWTHCIRYGTINILTTCFVYECVLCTERITWAEEDVIFYKTTRCMYIFMKCIGSVTDWNRIPAV